MSFDLEQLKPKGHRRIPQEQYLQLASAGVANWLAKAVPKDCNTIEFASELRRCADVYYRRADHDALQPARRGRPKDDADVIFICTMARTLQNVRFRIPITFRNYNATRRGQIGGKESPTTFQMICNTWMEYVDPGRLKALQPAAFKRASAYVKRATQRRRD